MVSASPHCPQSSLSFADEMGGPPIARHSMATVRRSMWNGMLRNTAPYRSGWSRLRHGTRWLLHVARGTLHTQQLYPDAPL